MSWWRRFLVRGVVWRQLLRWAVLNVPISIEPIVIAFWSLFFLLWGPGRRGVMRNLTAIKPGSWAVANFLRTYRVFWNFAWTITDNVRFKETRTTPDWEFDGLEHFEQLQARESGAIMLTAHMGSYDLGAQLFAETSSRPMTMVRAPEIDPQTREFEEAQHERLGDGLKIDFSTRATDLALDLLDAVRRGEIVAIQGDRVTPGITSIPATLFGKPLQIPAGPFALAMAARVPIFPLFVVRVGRRHYRLVTRQPIEVIRTRDRAESFERAVAQWIEQLENVVASHWYQWFTFEPYFEESAA